MGSFQPPETISLYDGEPLRDKDGNIIPEKHGGGLGCLIYPVVFLLLALLAWYAIKKLS
jgi:hypothetical protein